MHAPAHRVARRGFLSKLATASALASVSGLSSAGDPPKVTQPRATDGDDRFEPVWEERLTVKVGNSEGDFTGRSDRVIQAALDYVARLGGGTVQVLPGTYVLRNAVWLPSRTRLLGSHDKSILTRNASIRTDLTADSDWYDQEITLEEARGFQVGDGVVFQATNPHHGGATSSNAHWSLGMEIASNSTMDFGRTSGCPESPRVLLCSRC